MDTRFPRPFVGMVGLAAHALLPLIVFSVCTDLDVGLPA